MTLNSFLSPFIAKFACLIEARFNYVPDNQYPQTSSTRRSIETQIYTQYTDYQSYKQLKFVCMAGVIMPNYGVLSPQMAKFVCIWLTKSAIVCI